MTKVAIVTGAAQGIGEAIVLRLAKDGFDIALADLPQANLKAVAVKVQSLGRKAACIPTDVGVQSEVDALVQKTVEQLGRVDVMVANAGIAPVGPLIEVSEKTFDKLINVNVKGVLFCYQAAARQMIKQGEGGRMIAACSVAGVAPFPGLGAYCATKFAVRSLNQTFGIELGPHKINCNVYCPSPVDTQMWAKIDEDLMSNAGLPIGSLTTQKIADAPMGRLVNRNDVASLVSFFAGPDSSFISGESVLVTGAETLH